MPPSCIELTDVTVSPDDPWCGLDVAHNSCETRVPLQVQKDLEEYDLFLYTEASGARGLGTRAGLKEGQQIALCPSVIFTSLGKATSFLKSGANGFLASAVVRITEVPVHGEATTLFCCLTGAARYCADYVGIRKFPNCKFQFYGANGPSPGMLRLVVSTPNGRGIAPGQPLLLSFGPDYTHGWGGHGCNPEDGPEQKRFRGALDALFEKACVLEDSSNSDATSVPKPRGPAPNQTDSAPSAPKPTGPETTKPDPPSKPDPPKPDSSKPDPSKPDGGKPEVKPDAKPQGQAPKVIDVVEISEPPCRIWLQDSEPPTLHITSTHSANKRISKWTVLKVYKDGGLCAHVVSFPRLPAGLLGFKSGSRSRPSPLLDHNCSGTQT